ncbi:hypothetical protein K443DRAFT_103820 [Laccaria amethystina LaAM-08-1]|uniref:Acetyl-CoA synthetase-like protein n=1 Tax=Laccaria amethystina LaAM-08-1 TaxID=1095629 RepID=A0A0C9WMV4_9AGAR|nr:hypothetical protein K443DRAFT_103820 [Laccaria amethystina LaAM-08-1]
MAKPRGPRIYKSLIPTVPVIRQSIFTFLFEHGYYAWPSSFPALVNATDGRTITRGQLKDHALRLAWGLRNDLRLPSTPASTSDTTSRLSCSTHLARGDTVMIMSPNTLSWPVALFGCVAAGLRITFAGCTTTARELSWQWMDSKARCIILAPHLVQVAKDMFKLVGVSGDEADRRIWILEDETMLSSNHRTLTGNYLGTLLHGGMLSGEELFSGRDADETVYICYSSGTTTSHKNVASVLGMTNAVWRGCETDSDVYLAVLPVYHMFGMLCNSSVSAFVPTTSSSGLAMLLHYPLMRGRPLVMLNEGFEPDRFCKAIEDYKVTTLMLVPPILLTLSTHAAVDKYDLRTLTNVASGAAPLSLALANKFLGRLKSRGVNVYLLQGCGSTETTCPAQIVAPEDSARKFGSVGQLLPNIEARIMHEADGLTSEAIDVEEGHPGELWLRGPTITKGYLNNPSANESSFTVDGWFKTGDILRRDQDGYFYIVDRKKEMIKYKGYQVAPAELEAILMENTEVADVGVIGIMNNYSGDELPRAYVTPSNPAVLALAESKRAFEMRIKHWIEGQVSQYKYLRGGVVAVNDVPKSPTGKILRKDLREWARIEQERSRKANMARL